VVLTISPWVDASSSMRVCAVVSTLGRGLLERGLRPSHAGLGLLAHIGDQLAGPLGESRRDLHQRLARAGAQPAELAAPRGGQPGELGPRALDSLPDAGQVRLLLLADRRGHAARELLLLGRDGPDERVDAKA
jgi:hypothetical protein